MSEMLLKITNMVRAEADHVSKTSLPLEVFPQQIQNIIFLLAHYENFNIEYVVAIILSVIATAIGNACHILVKGSWEISPSIYMMLIGRPGLGKTPPLNFLYKPIRERDRVNYQKYKEEYDAYRKELAERRNCKGEDCYSEMIDEPNLITTVVSDLTPEAMMRVHYNNPRGIVIVADEILALFNSVKRYSNKNNLIEDLLSAYSGQTLKTIRKSESIPILINNPCINLIGSIQTDLLSEVFCKSYKGNGLLDRFLFVYPENRMISKWVRSNHEETRPDIQSMWATIVNRIMDLPCPIDNTDHSIKPNVLRMNDEAEKYFFDWHNRFVDEANSIQDDLMMDSRRMKLDGNAARLALVFQIMKWAAGEGNMLCVDLDSVKSAIRMIDYYENTYQRIQDIIVSGNLETGTDDWLAYLNHQFTSKEALEVGKRMGMSRRSVYYALDNLCSLQHPVIIKVRHGVYEKKEPANTNALCTFALSDKSADQQSICGSSDDSAKSAKCNQQIIG